MKLGRVEWYTTQSRFSLKNIIFSRNGGENATGRLRTASRVIIPYNNHLYLFIKAFI